MKKMLGLLIAILAIGFIGCDNSSGGDDDPYVETRKGKITLNIDIFGNTDTITKVVFKMNESGSKDVIFDNLNMSTGTEWEKDFNLNFKDFEKMIYSDYINLRIELYDNDTKFNVGNFNFIDNKYKGGDDYSFKLFSNGHTTLKLNHISGSGYYYFDIQ